MSYQGALRHAAKASLTAAALVEEMSAGDPTPRPEDLAALLVRVDDIVSEAEVTRVELRVLDE
jgi:hypothetical protein